MLVWIGLLVPGQLCVMPLLDFYLQLNVFLNLSYLVPPVTPVHHHAVPPTVAHSAQGHYARKLLNDLMEDYSNALRPVEDTDEALNVSLQITLSQIKDMVSRKTDLTCQT